MKITTIYGEQNCAGAQQRNNGVFLFDENGSVIICIEDATDILHIDGGEIVVVETPEPTNAEILEAQITYTAMMTDTLLEG